MREKYIQILLDRRKNDRIHRESPHPSGAVYVINGWGAYERALKGVVRVTVSGRGCRVEAVG